MPPHIIVFLGLGPLEPTNYTFWYIKGTHIALKFYTIYGFDEASFIL
jgi:hypothetical protein